MGKWFGSLDCWMMGVDVYDESTSVTFTYDADLDAFVQQPDVRLYFNDAYNAPSPMALQMLGGLTLKGNCSGLLDGIRHTTTLTATPLQFYNLAGQPVGKRPSAGVYISDGKKRIAK